MINIITIYNHHFKSYWKVKHKIVTQVFSIYLYYYKYSMSRRNKSKTRVEYWANYRETIANDFESEQKLRDSRRKQAENKSVKVEKDPPLTKAEALLNEYEKKNENKQNEVRKGPIGLLYGLAIIVLLLIIAGIIFMIWRFGNA
ncbi:MAG: hypothetical protein BWY30_00614 [Tenericutes bacterium ADurb.Bin239]|nr:MAG: hypothetical protein BWY30_00614 [Tenericutes bacterium ADurb.Bin239]